MSERKIMKSELKYIIHHENIAYLNWPIDESESYGNCTLVTHTTMSGYTYHYEELLPANVHLHIEELVFGTI